MKVFRLLLIAAVLVSCGSQKIRFKRTSANKYKKVELAATTSQEPTNETYKELPTDLEAEDPIENHVDNENFNEEETEAPRKQFKEKLTDAITTLPQQFDEDSKVKQFFESAESLKRYDPDKTKLSKRFGILSFIFGVLIYVLGLIALLAILFVLIAGADELVFVITSLLVILVCISALISLVFGIISISSRNNNGVGRTFAIIGVVLSSLALVILAILILEPY